MFKTLLRFCGFLTKEERLVLTAITAGFQKVKDDLKALQEQNKAEIVAHERQLAEITAKKAELQTEHDQAVAIHSNISKLLEIN